MLRYSIAALLLLSGAPVWASFPDGVLDERQRDFGVVPRGQQLVHYFRLVNNTEQPLHIYNVRVSCGCTTARALNTTVPPGQESAIWANMDSRRFLGHKAVTIYVSFDQPRYEEIRLVVQAYSRDDIIFSPDGINLGKVHQGEAKTGTMNITFYNNGQAQALEASAESSFLQPSLKEVKRTGAETTYQVITKIRPDTPAGVWFTDVWVKTSVPGAPKLRVPVTVEVDTVQPVQVQPKDKPNVKTSQAEPPVLSPALTPEASPTNSATQPEPPAPSDSSVQPEPQSSRPSIFPSFVNFFRR